MLNNHPDSFALVTVHMDAYQIPWGSNRFFGFYDLTYTPTVVFGGDDIHVGTTNYEALYQGEVAVPSDVTIELTADPPDMQSTDIHANVCIEAGGLTKTMRIYMVQVLDYWPPPHVKPNQRNCLMQAASTQDVSLAPGECAEVVESFTFDSDSWAHQDDIGMIVWAQRAQSPGPAQVFQAAIMGWPFEPHTVPCDFDLDRDVDQYDADMFLLCYTGPDGGVPPGCEPGDTEPDGDVDCDDWAVLKDHWTGPPDYPPFFLDCDDDCNTNTVADEWDIDAGASIDCNGNTVPDECEIDQAGGPGYHCDPGDPPPPLVSCDPDCNANGVPDECDIAGATSEDCNENTVPDSCDIASGTSPDTNEDGIPDECEIVMPLPEDCGTPCETATVPCVAHQDCRGIGAQSQARCLDGTCYAPKNRYVSIARNPVQVTSTARRIKLLNDDLLGWIGEPYYVEPSLQHDGLWLAEIVAAPVYDGGIDFADPWPSVLHLTGCTISTGQTYKVQAIAHGWPIGDEQYYSDVLELHTAGRWGDVVGACGPGGCSPPDGTASINDIMAEIGLYQGGAPAPITWLDTDPSFEGQTPDQVISIGDIMYSIAGFQGGSYPGPAPEDCP